MKNVIKTGYVPSEYIPSDNEEYMNEKQLRFFENKLLQQQKELEQKIKTTIEKLKTINSASPDLVDQGNHENETAWALKDMERNNHLLHLSKKALKRIENGYFGYCVITGQAIGLKRLNLIPTTTMSIDAMRMFEKNNSVNSSDAMEYSFAC